MCLYYKILFLDRSGNNDSLATLRISFHIRGRHPVKGIQGYSLLPEKALER